MRIKPSNPCLVLSGETGETYLGVVVAVDDDSVTVENRSTGEQAVLEHNEIVPAQWAKDGKRKKRKGRR